MKGPRCALVALCLIGPASRVPAEPVCGLSPSFMIDGREVVPSDIAAICGVGPTFVLDNREDLPQELATICGVGQTFVINNRDEPQAEPALLCGVSPTFILDNRAGVFPDSSRLCGVSGTFMIDNQFGTRCDTSGSFTVNTIGGNVPTLTVGPASRSASSAAGTTTFAVSNAGGGSFTWTAAVVNSAWLWIVGPAGGVNSGQISVGFAANVNPGPRVGTIRVLAPGATPSAVDVTVVQAGTSPGATLSHFTFSNVSSPQLINTPFPATVTARTQSGGVATTFGGVVYLFAHSGADVTPRSVVLANGVWTGNVSIDEPSDVSALSCSGGGATGHSNEFELAAGTGPGRLTVTVRGRGSGSPVPDAVVDLKRVCVSNPPQPISQVTGDDGTCTFPGLTPGKYSVSARHIGSINPYLNGVALDQLVQVAARATAITAHLGSDACPVLLVPGILGSAEWDNELWPGLPAQIPAPASYLDLMEQPGWAELRTRLRQQGYEVFDVPWDWRLSNFTEPDPSCEGCEMESSACGQRDMPAWQLYLMPAIRRARLATGHEKVHVVAHSAGGLLTRAYIQSELYNHDIDKFAMVGTPNGGAGAPYYMWYGGDPAKADAETCTGLDCLFHVYTCTTAELYYTMRFDFDAPNICAILVGHQTIRQFFHNDVPGLGDLIAVYPLLGNPGSLARIVDPEIPGLRDLNRPENVGGVTSESIYGGADSAPTLVRTVQFSSVDQRTIRSIPVGAPGTNGLYPYGAPQGASNRPTMAGDGTVHRRGWTCDFDPDCREIFFEIDHVEGNKGEHGKLIGEFADEIVQFLGPPDCGGVASLQPVAELGWSSELRVGARGRVQILLVDSASLASGIDPASGEFFSTIPGADATIHADSGVISVKDPAAGAFEMRISAPVGELVATRLLFKNVTGVVEHRLSFISDGDVISVPFTLVPDAADPIVILRGISAPTNMESARSASGLTELTWGPPNEGDVAAYKVYARPADGWPFTEIGQVVQPPFEAHAWNADGAQAGWFYTVAAVSESGIESDVPGLVENTEHLAAAFSADERKGHTPLTVQFTDQSSGEPTSWAWDFESDGVIDSSEQNPMHTFESVGRHTVSLTVGSPQGTDTRIDVGMICVAGYGDVDADCDVDLSDWAALTAGLLGPSVPAATGDLAWLDPDLDGDIDLRDCAAVQNAFDGCAANCP